MMIKTKVYDKNTVTNLKFGHGYIFFETNTHILVIILVVVILLEEYILLSDIQIFEFGSFKFLNLM